MSLRPTLVKLHNTNEEFGCYGDVVRGINVKCGATQDAGLSILYIYNKTDYDKIKQLNYNFNKQWLGVREFRYW